jgi:uncharacterized protein YkwD
MFRDFRFALVAVCLLSLTTLAATPHAAAASTAWKAASYRTERFMLRVINHDRRVSGLAPLRFDSQLEHAAVAHSLDMAVHGYFSHTAPDGASPYDRMGSVGVRYHVAGENLGYDEGGQARSMLRSIEVAMLKSPEHRANLLRVSFQRVGIGIALAGSQVYVTEDFAG